MDHSLSSWYTATHKNTWKIYRSFGEPIFHGFTMENTGELYFDNLTLIQMLNWMIIEFSKSELCGPPSFIMAHCNTQEHMKNLQVLWRDHFSWIHYGEYRRIVFWQSYTHPNAKLNDNWIQHIQIVWTTLFHHGTLQHTRTHENFTSPLESLFFMDSLWRIQENCILTILHSSKC